MTGPVSAPVQSIIGVPGCAARLRQPPPGSDTIDNLLYASPLLRIMIVEERRRTLYVEGQFYFTKLRNLDLLWFPRAQGIVPARGDLYGGGVRMHMPNDEFTLNENLTLDDRATGCAVNERPVRFQ